MTRCRTATAVGLFAILSVFPAAAAPASLNPLQQSGSVFTRQQGGQIVHNASGFVFLSELAGMNLVTERAFTADNVTARYGASGPKQGQPWLDLSIYPADSPIESEARHLDELIADKYSGRRLESQPGPPDKADNGRSGWFSATIDGRAMTTAYVIARRGEWAIKVRATSPDPSPASLDRLERAIAEIKWDWKPSRAAEAARLALSSGAKPAAGRRSSAR